MRARLRRLVCVMRFGHRIVQTRGGYFCDRCDTPRGW